ncbi:N-acetyltransferase [Bacillus salacetis]|uniref:N-acetyltransferase n=1 Tax=Bacillus salacetis TaxID=2315464 RepID=A0A3A1R3E1_9BACI|nr:GNAT family protein [Bacillus salacetis]RIW33312.1 N-acetyltransferase [Bacillus salacetis]
MIIVGDRIFLRTFEEGDAKALTKIITRNKPFWGRAEPDWPESYYTVEGQIHNIRFFREGIQKGQHYSFGIFDKGTYKLIGLINLYDIKWGPFRSGVVGYSVDKKHNGKGVGTESLLLILGFTFNHLNLNRVSAEVLPRNAPSIRVLEKAGFLKEGIKRDSTLIQGTWETHLQFGLLKKEWEKL